MGTFTDLIGNVDIVSLIEVLITGGWVQVVFPFLLIYAIVFTSLNNIDLFNKKKSIVVLVSLIISFFGIAFPIGNSCETPFASNILDGSWSSYANGCTLADYMAILFPGVTLLGVIILCIIILAGLVGFDLEKLFKKDEEFSSFKVILFGFFLFIFGIYVLKTFGLIDTDNDFFKPFFEVLKDGVLWTFIIFAGIIYWMTSDEENKEKKIEKETITREK